MSYLMRTVRNICCFSFTLLFASFAFSAESNPQLDRIETKVESVITKQDQVLDIIDENPLKNKKFGIEINPFRLLFIDKDDKTFSGSFSIFNVSPNVEIAIPIYASSSGSGNNKFRSLTIDGHYRYFLNKHAKGFYISGMSRFTALHGTLGKNYDYFNDELASNKDRDSTYKLGIGFGLGYRVFSKSGFYWGAGLSLGRYIVGENDRYQLTSGDLASDIDDQEVIIDVEFFKFGYAF